MKKEHLVQLKEALQHALVYIHEHPSDTAPTRELRAVLTLLDEIGEDERRHHEVLQKILDSIFDAKSGAVLRPQPEIAELLRHEIKGFQGDNP